MTTPARVNVLGVGISTLNLQSATKYLLAAVHEPSLAGFVTVTGVHGVVESQRDGELRKIHNRSLLSTPDGMPMVWLGKHAGYAEMGRVYGPDLFLSLSEASPKLGLRHFYFGGREGVAQDLKEQMEERLPALEVSGLMCPPFRPLTSEEDAELVQTLQNKRPHFLWVGLGTPKQERFMHDFLARHPDLTTGWDHGLILLGVGAAFDFHTGRVRQAPKFIQRSGFEWLFRLFMDPKRLFKRYAYGNTIFLSKIFPQLFGWKRYPLSK